ncbi:MAG TPA: hypothetical protein IAA67_07650 [Candidatus Avoscillospira stercorigallinarum]|uniref:Uncharacterized protein n=1 Tax=Candidatus Avoscillospira stercorigallinarum TaxID=2840708 RepID=A0A9D0Z941_9FIRM|nr:hypothetical protein [Candidatus Avoscillospira stercorigallinarum]
MADRLPVDPAQMQAVLGSSRGKALLALLEGNQDEAVTQALAAVKAGQYQRALALLKPYLEARGLGEEAARRG